MMRKPDQIIIGTYGKPDHIQPHPHLLLSFPTSRHLSALDLRPAVIPSVGTSLPSGPYQILSFHLIDLQQLTQKLNGFFFLVILFIFLTLCFAPGAPADILG